MIHTVHAYTRVSEIHSKFKTLKDIDITILATESYCYSQHMLEGTSLLHSSKNKEIFSVVKFRFNRKCYLYVILMRKHISSLKKLLCFLYMMFTFLINWIIIDIHWCFHWILYLSCNFSFIMWSFKGLTEEILMIFLRCLVFGRLIFCLNGRNCLWLKCQFSGFKWILLIVFIVNFPERV